jgi:hypothetical protein
MSDPAPILPGPLSPEDVTGWRNSAADGPEAASARVLSQTEIDDLVGFNDLPVASEPKSGLHRVVSAGLISYERLPMLEIVFDRLVRILSTSLRHLTSDNVEVSIDKITSLRFGDYMNAVPLPAMLSVFKAEQWDNFGLMVIDAPMIYSIVDAKEPRRPGSKAALTPQSSAPWSRRWRCRSCPTYRFRSIRSVKYGSSSNAPRSIRASRRSPAHPMPRSW